jgi:hypothetical protein
MFELVKWTYKALLSEVCLGLWQSLTALRQVAEPRRRGSYASLCNRAGQGLRGWPEFHRS